MNNVKDRINEKYSTNIRTITTDDFDATDPPNEDIIRSAINAVYRLFNETTAKDSFNSTEFNVDHNLGFELRKNLLFNTTGNVMDATDAGRFKFRIPLDHMFNFCKFYRNGIYNARHELRFTRQTDDMAIYRHVNADVGKIRLDKIRWMMPRVTLNPELSIRLKETILKPDVNIPVSFINKYLRKHTVVTGVINFPVTYTLPGINSVRYIVLLFQTRDLLAYPILQTFNNSTFNNPFNRRTSMIDISNITAKVGGQSFYIGDYTNNNMSTNLGSSFYNEFKKLRQDYLNDYRDTDMITYAEFINLYRMYCINVAAQTIVSDATSSDIELEITLNSIVPRINTEINLYTITYYDSKCKFKYDGQKHVCVQ